MLKISPLQPDVGFGASVLTWVDVADGLFVVCLEDDLGVEAVDGFKVTLVVAFSEVGASECLVVVFIVLKTTNSTI